jgi:hypothetical protein
MYISSFSGEKCKAPRRQSAQHSPGNKLWNPYVFEDVQAWGQSPYMEALILLGMLSAMRNWSLSCSFL